MLACIRESPLLASFCLPRLRGMGRSLPVANVCFGSIVLKKSASVFTAEKYASEIEVCVLRRRFRAQI